MSVREATEIFANRFQIFHAKVPGKYPGVRFMAPPYDDMGSACKVQMDPRNPEHLSGPAIEGVLAKFKIPDAEFKAAYNEYFGTKRGRSA